jgi:hypothetical protein
MLTYTSPVKFSAGAFADVVTVVCSMGAFLRKIVECGGVGASRV